MVRIAGSDAAAGPGADLITAAAAAPPAVAYLTNWSWACFVRDRNVFDFTILVMCAIPALGSQASLLRLLRLLRVLKLLKMIEQLQIILRGLARGMSSIGYIAMLLFLVFYLFGIIGIMLVHRAALAIRDIAARP